MLALLPASAAADGPDRILLQRDAGLSAAERADIRADAGVKLAGTVPVPRTEVVTAPAGRGDAALAALERDPDVRWAMPEPVFRALAPTNDTYLGDQWAVENFTGLPDADLDGVEAWDRATGLGQTVAVIDTGVQESHLDLQDNLLPGYDYVEGDSTPQDDDDVGHGTHVTGIVAAVGDNSRGVAGLAYGAQVMPLRVIGPEGASFLDVIEALEDADDAGVRVVNASLGTDPDDLTPEDAEEFDDVLTAVIEDHPDVLFVAAAGNETNDNDAKPVFPCNAQAANLVCVGATTDDDQIAGFSNVGRLSVDLFAPGDDILSTVPGGYNWLSGTSMASPQVAAIAALALEVEPTHTTPQLKQAILGSADLLADAELDSVTDARANANNALLWLDFPDFDGDLVANTADNCWQEPNAGQENLDGDLRGDACDGDDDGDRVADAFDQCPTIKGSPAYAGCAPPPPPPPSPTPVPIPAPTAPADVDGDGVYDVSDACRSIYAVTKDGCPLPQVSALSARVKRRTVRVRITTSRDAVVRITVKRKKGTRWVRVIRRTRTTSDGRTGLTARRLRSGRYRVYLTVYNSSGTGTARSKSFRVR